MPKFTTQQIIQDFLAVFYIYYLRCFWIKRGEQCYYSNDTAKVYCLIMSKLQFEGYGSPTGKRLKPAPTTAATNPHLKVFYRLAQIHSSPIFPAGKEWRRFYCTKLSNTSRCYFLYNNEGFLSILSGKNHHHIIFISLVERN